MLFKRNRDPRLASESLTHGFALVFLLILGGFAIAGPSGVIAWSEQQRLLEKREGELATLAEEREQLRNRVQLLDPRHADADLAGQLLRSQLNVAHPDEMVMLLN